MYLCFIVIKIVTIKVKSLWRKSLWFSLILFFFCTVRHCWECGVKRRGDRWLLQETAVKNFIINGLWIHVLWFWIFHKHTQLQNIFHYLKLTGTAVAQWLRCCATNLKVTGSIPHGVIGIFHWHNPSDRTMALGSTQSLIEMSTRRISWG